MKNVKIAILEDELLEQEKTVNALNRFFNENNIEFEYFAENDPNKFLEHDLSNYDLAILDIIMPHEVNGFDVSKVVREKYPKIAIIFLTKTLNYAINGYEVRALNYLLKPLIYEDFALKMMAFLKTLNTNGSKIHSFKCQGSIIQIVEKDIIYIDIYKHYLNIHTKDNIYVTRGNINTMIKALSNIFSCCSSYCIINFQYLEEIKKDDVVLKNGEMFKITAKYKKDFMRDFSTYLLNNE